MKGLLDEYMSVLDHMNAVPRNADIMERTGWICRNSECPREQSRPRLQSDIYSVFFLILSGYSGTRSILEKTHVIAKSVAGYGGLQLERIWAVFQGLQCVCLCTGLVRSFQKRDDLLIRQRRAFVFSMEGLRERPNWTTQVAIR